MIVPQNLPSSSNEDPTYEEIQRRGAVDRLVVAAAMAEAARRGLKADGTRLASLIGPQTDEELLEAVEGLTGYRIPRASVCLDHGHVSPAQTFCDVYFDRIYNVLWIGNRGGGKLCALDTLIPMVTGWTTMGTIRDGDWIFDDQGCPTRVLKVHDVVAAPESYRVEFSDGTFVLAGAEHLWETWSWRLRRCGNNNKRMVREANVVTTAQIRDTLYRKHGAKNEFNHSIPVAKPLECPEADLLVDPYILGAWLGDGDSHGGYYKLHTNRDEARFFVEQTAAVGLESRVTDYPGGTASAESRQVVLDSSIHRGLVQLGLLRNKHIPMVYLRASVDQRRAVLQGLMDTDGHITKEGKAELTTVSIRLRDGAMELLRSLGYKPTWTGKHVAPSGNVSRWGVRDKYGPYYRIRFQPYTDEPPVRMPHKVARLKSRPATPQMSTRRQITAVVPVDPVPMRCITVDSPSALYLCGEGMVPTHNTTNSGFLHGAKARWNDQYTSTIAGAVGKQGGRAYAEFKRFIRDLGTEVIDTLLSKTEWANGSETEVLMSSTVAQLNGPHPIFSQLDELELTTQEPFQEFLNMAQANSRYPAIQLLTSTRKRAWGLVQSIVSEVQEAVRDGNEPPWEVRIFCVFETMAPVPNCRSAPENADRPEDELCQCHKVRKGQWENGTQRTFDKVCGGRGFRADGFVQLADVLKRFTQLSQATWEAQQECLRPSQEGIVHKWITNHHRLVRWFPLKAFGPIYRGWDWGGENPHAVVWCQLLSVPVGLDGNGLPVLNEEYEDRIERVIPANTLIQFDEIYGNSDQIPGDGGFSDLGVAVAFREEMWRAQRGFEDMTIEQDFCDPAGLVAKKEVRKAYKNLIESGDHPSLVVPNFRSTPAPRMESVRMHISWGESGKIMFVPSMTPNTDDEYDVYHWPVPKEGKNLSEDPAKEDDHCLIAGTSIWTKRGQVSIEKVMIDDEVMTRCGWKRVIACWDNGIRDLYEATLDDGTSLVATGNHPICVVGDGFTRLDSIRYNRWSWRSLFDRWFSRRGLTLFKRSNIGESFIGAIRNLDIENCGITLLPIVRMVVGVGGFIAWFGQMRMALFRRITIFITRMVIVPTTALRIWNVSPRQSIWPNMLVTEIRMNSERSWLMPQSTLKNGIDRTKGAGGTVSNKLEGGQNKLKHGIANVINAALSSRSGQWVSRHSPDFVQMLAKLRRVVNPGWMTKSASVWCAKGYSSSTSIDALNVAPVLAERRIRTVNALPTKARVYDLMVEDEHEFFANGILVGNSMDAVRYLIWNLQLMMGRAPAEQPEALERVAKANPEVSPYSPPQTDPSTTAVLSSDEQPGVYRPDIGEVRTQPSPSRRALAGPGSRR